MLVRPHHHHGHRAVRGHEVADRAEQPTRQLPPTARADHDELGTGELGEGVARVAGVLDRLHPQVRCQPAHQVLGVSQHTPPSGGAVDAFCVHQGNRLPCQSGPPHHPQQGEVAAAGPVHTDDERAGRNLCGGGHEPTTRRTGGSSEGSQPSPSFRPVNWSQRSRT